MALSVVCSAVTVAVFFLALWLMPFETFTPFPFPRFPGFFSACSHQLSFLCREILSIGPRDAGNREI